MATYVIPVNTAQIAALGDDGPQAITEYLEGQGVSVTSVTLRLRPAPAVVIESDVDPAPFAAGFAAAMSAERTRLRQGAQIALGYATKYEAWQASPTVNPAPTAAETQRAVWVTIRLLEWHLRGGGVVD
jgi:hypothetical protein